MDNQTNEVTLNGKRYISVKRASELSLYTTDYIGQLCRSGKLDATRIGRNWYVEEGSIIEHKQLQAVSGGASVGENNVVTPKREVRTDAKGVFKNSFVVYSKDNRPLMPELVQVDKESKNIPITILDDYREQSVVDTKETSPISMHSSNTPSLESSTASLSSLRNIILATAALLAVFVILFSALGNQYTRSVVFEEFTNPVAFVAETSFVQTIMSEIIYPLELVAQKMSTYMNKRTYEFLYGDVMSR